MNIHAEFAQLHDVTGLVLAGGRGLRFGGVDKGLIEFRGRSLTERQLELLAPQVARVVVSANRNLARYRGFGVEVVGDCVPDWSGPLAGMLAGARSAGTAWIACMPCDMLDAPHDTVARLLVAARAASVPAAYAQGPDGPQYALCLLHTRLVDVLQTALDMGHRAVRDFLHAQGAVAADFRDCALRNVNYPEMLA